MKFNAKHLTWLCLSTVLILLFIGSCFIVIDSTKPDQPLSFTSGGRLPTKVHGFSLGMSVPEALAVDPNLKPVDDLKDPSKHESGDMWSHPDGYSLALGFWKGRLYSINSVRGSLSPSDAESYDNNILKRLGKPQVENYRGSDNREWVWIDGDVRIKYSDRLYDAGRSVDLKMVLYPAMMSRAQDWSEKTPSSAGKELLVSNLRAIWESVGPRIVKPLPAAYDGLSLGMTPSQVRAVVPGITITNYDNEYSQQYTPQDSYGYRYSRGSSPSVQDRLPTTNVEFWDDHLFRIVLFHNDISAEVLNSMPESLLQQFGTPTKLTKCEGETRITWENETTRLNYDIASSGIQVSVDDKTLQSTKKAVEMERRPPQYKTAPENRSFF